MLQEKQIVPMGSLDRHLETRLQGCGAGDVIDMAMVSQILSTATLA
jgi:hypothetical protein